MPKENMIIQTDNAPQAIGAYTQGVVFNQTYYFSGMLGINPETKELENGFEPQLGRIMKNIDALLQSQNLSRNHIIKTTIFIKDLGNFSKVNSAYEKYFDQPYPARSCVEVKGLPKNADIEIEVIAAKFN